MNTDISKANAEWLASGCVECAKKHLDPGLLAAIRKEVLLEAVDVCKTIANDAEDCGATPEMLEIVYAIEAELRRMAERDK